MSVRIVLLDDHHLFREGLRAAMSGEPDLLVVGEASDARAALNTAEAESADVVVADISLPGLSGIAFARELLRRRPTCRILILTMHARADLAADAFAAGVHGYALKDELPTAIVASIRDVAQGKTYVTLSLPASVAADVQREREHDGGGVDPLDPLASLSSREREVFDLVVLGFTNENVAQRLSISIKTVQTHRARINQKLDLHSTSELVRFAARRGLPLE